MVELMKKAVLEEVEKSSLEFNKRSKHKHKHKHEHQSLQQKEMYNPFDDELSPLGLHLRKSPSLLDLIQIRLLSHQNTHNNNNNNNNNNDKLKASNFLASLLRIGTWEYKSKYEGELVAKCYFAKHKLVWEVLDGSLKNKIEIQWSDIVAIKAIYPDDGPGTLDVVLSRRPLFFRETNPQPRKHTLWQASSDFTGGQASVYRRHFLQCPQGMLDKHFEKLIQCDPRLSFLSQLPEIVLECPYFESNVAGFEEPNEYGSDMKSEETLLGAVASPSGAQSSFSTNEQDFIARAPENYIEETPSPSSVMDANKIEEMRSIADKDSKFLSNLEQIKVPVLHPSMSMSDLVGHFGHCISEQMANDRPIFSGNKRGRDILEEVTQILLSDSQSTSASDEQSLMCRVNSLCCLLPKDPSTSQNLQAKCDENIDINSDQNMGEAFAASTNESNPAEGDGESNDGSGCKQAPAMSRKDSFAELLLNLPRIASLPRFWFSLPEDSNNHSR